MDIDLNFPVITKTGFDKKILTMDEYLEFCQFNYDQISAESKAVIRQQRRLMAVLARFSLHDFVES